jgi:hypothetical protein
MPPQIQRLAMLVVAIVGAYFAARGVLRPHSFGQYGWYRGAALGELSALPASFAGRAACAECHAETVAAMEKSKHKDLSCESCHGANLEHSQNPATTTRKITNPRFCLRCHEANPSRPSKFPQVDPAEHFADSTCLECHQPHAPTEISAK